jgi:ubiquinone/menaquinone biosynthesis C-methylase UbiE
MNNVINEWNNAAESYSEDNNKSIYSLFCKNFVIKYFSNVKNLKILDAGCGNGDYTHILTENGGNVIGCDGSDEMVKIAKTKYPKYIFENINLQNKLPYENNIFDIIFCNLVLMDIDPIDNVISEFNRVLKNNGKLFFSIVHPSFYSGEWEKNENGKIISKKIIKYITPYMEKQKFWGITTHYHRPISFYYNKLSEKGFKLNKMLEPKVYEESKIQDIPLYLFTELIKKD